MIFDPIIQAVQQATILCREVQHNSLRSMNKLSQDKGDTEPVTMADYGAQAIICRAIAQHFPEDAVLSEEAGEQFVALTTDRQKAEIINLLTTILDVNVVQDDIIRWLDHGSEQQARRTWIIDPIDGTKGFIAMRHYAIGIGIVEAGQPTGAFIAAPGYGDGVSGDDDEGLLFYVHDAQAYQMPLMGGAAQAITVSDRQAAPFKLVQSYEKSHSNKERMARARTLAQMQDAHILELDSMEKYALVANGDADAYMRLPNIGSNRPHMVWDHAPGAALVLAAGGNVTDLNGQPLDFSQGHTLPTKGMLVSNGHIHQRLLDAIAQLLQEENA